MDKTVHLTDLIDAGTLQRIQDAFSAMTGMAALTTDAEGIPVTTGSNFSDFCTKHVRNSEDGHIRCEQCDKFGAEDSWKRGGSTSYYCHAGLIDFAAPILADKQMVGSFIGGQVLTQPPERGHIYEIAWELGIDPQELWDAAQKIRVIDKKKIEDAAQFLFTVSNVLSDMAYGKYQMLQANLEIERANNMKSDFLANMSHEIRTPMNAVIGMAEMALREELSPAVREYLTQIKVSGRALLTIINDILDFSKIESGRMDIVPAEYEAMSIVNDVANIAVERLKEKDVELILDISPNIPHTLVGDNIRIKQILLNLVNNAAKFTHTGRITVRMSHAPLRDGNVMIRFDVEDTGIGIREGDLEAIFDSFQQVDSRRNRNIEGTGLGLAISRRLTKLMDGTMTVRSRYGEGSTFSFELPQKVSDDRPCSVVLHTEKKRAFALIENPYVRENLAHDCERLGVELTWLTSQGAPVCDEERETFLFFEEALFTDELRDRIKSLPKLTAVCLYSFNAQTIASDMPNLLLVRKPLCTMNVARIFNGEDLYRPDVESDAPEIDFMAPTAKILVVDDNTINLIVTEGLLEPLKMKVETATGGQEAIEKIANTRYDIIFMDHMMPDMDGVETTQIIRRQYPEYADVPIIALTANAMSGIREMFLAEGMNDFVSKPIELKSLIRKVAKWLPPEKKEHREAAETPAPLSEEKLVIGDLDTEHAIQMMGSRQLYLSVLKGYYKIIEQKAERIRELEAREAWDAYTIEVHSLKSTSRQIGAVLLSQQAEDMEDAGNARDAARIHTCTGAMLERYLGYIPVLAPLCEEQEGQGDGEPVTPALVADFFETLTAAIDELDMDRMEQVISEMKRYSYDDRQKALFARLCEAVESVDVDACEEIMKEWST